MKLINDISELKKGDNVIVKDYSRFEALGLGRISGFVFSLEEGKSNFTIKCTETDSIEEVNVESGKIFFIN